MTRKFGIFIFVIVGALTFAGTAYSQAGSSPEKLTDIRKLMNLTGAGEIGDQVVEQMMYAMRMSAPDAPAEFWDEIRQGIHPEELVELNVPIYDKYLSHEDIKAIIAFYQSPVGAKFLSVLPNIAQESYQAGGRWGNELAQGVAQKMIDKGYLDPRQLGISPAEPGSGE